MHIDKNHAEVSNRAAAATDSEVSKSRMTYTYIIYMIILLCVRQRVYWEGIYYYMLLSSIWKPLRRRSRDIRIKRCYILYINIMLMYPYIFIVRLRSKRTYVYNNNTGNNVIMRTKSRLFAVPVVEVPIYYKYRFYTYARVFHIHIFYYNILISHIIIRVWLYIPV